MAATRLISTFLFVVKPTDPLTIVAAVVIVFVVAIVAVAMTSGG